MKRIDLKKILKPLYTASARSPTLIDVPGMSFLMVDGQGDPDGETFREAVASIYRVAYTLKFSLKKERAIEYPVMVLEGLWWVDDTGDFLLQRRDRWKWTALIALPDLVTKTEVRNAAAEARKKAGSPRFPSVRMETFKEGRCVQLLHVGPYSAEGPAIERLHAFAAAQGYRLKGKHHEIYLGDPRRSAPDKLKTILRRPVARTRRSS